MYYIDAYADMYQKLQGFKIFLKDKGNELVEANLSFEQSTRSTYDIAMRDATIDGLVTMDDLSKLKLGQLFYKEVNPNELYIIQAINKTEQQAQSKNINAIKQNCYITVYRKEYNEESETNEYMEKYKDIVGFVSIQNKDQKNFGAGIEDNTILNMQIPRKNIVDDYVYDIRNLDRIVIEDLERNRKDEVKIESIDAYGVPGVIRLQGTFDTRTGDTRIGQTNGTEVQL